MATPISLVNRLRQADLPTVPVSFSAWLEIDGKEYAIVKLAVRYSRTETKTVVDLASGNASRDIGGRPAISPDFKFVKGVPARVLIKVDDDVRALWASAPDQAAEQDFMLKKGTHVIMDGVIDEGGPSDLSRGRFNMRCVIVSKLLYLASGATHFSNVSTAHLNTLVATSLSSNEVPAQVNERIIERDFWDGIRTGMLNIIQQEFGFSNASLIARLNQFFGTAFKPVPVATVNALQSIYGELRGGRFSDSDMARTVTEYLNAELYKDMGRQSILARIQGMAEDFFFALVEHGPGYAVVPYTPFVHSSQCKNLWPSTIESVSWTQHSTVVVSGLVFIDNPFGNIANGPKSPQTHEQFILGGYKRAAAKSAVNSIDPEGNNLGLVTTLPAPAWMRGVDSGVAGIQTQTIRGSYGNVYARELALKQSYIGRGVSVRGPFRMDIGPCTPVHIIYPAVAGTGVTEETSMYGAVEAVTLVIDASAASAMTEMEVMYVRSQAQQELDIDQRPVDTDGLAGFGDEGSGFVSTQGFHPLWAEPYLGRRLDERPSDVLTETISRNESESPDQFGQ